MIKRGQRPWSPKPDAQILDVWHEYEIPLTGTFQLHECSVLFTQVMETPKGTSAWAYLCLSDEDAIKIKDIKFVSLDEMHQFVESSFVGKEAVMALARDDKITHWSRVTVHNSLDGAFEDFLNTVIQSVDEDETNRERRVRAKLVGLEAAEDELAGV
ncbi:hypothetical protein [Herbidospora sp. RD11066]